MSTGSDRALSLDSKEYHRQRSSSATSSRTSAPCASSQTSAPAAARHRDAFTRTRRGACSAFRLRRRFVRRSETSSRNCSSPFRPSRLQQGRQCTEARAGVTSRSSIDGSRMRLGRQRERYRWRSFRMLCLGLGLLSCVMLFAVVLCSCLRCVGGIRFSAQRALLIL